MSARNEQRSSVEAWMQTIQVNDTQDFKQTIQVNGDTEPFPDTEPDDLPPVVRAIGWGMGAVVAAIATVAAAVLVVLPWLADRVLR